MEAVSRSEQQQGHGGGDPFDIFDFFGGGGGGGRRQRHNRGDDLKVKVRTSLKDLYMGKEYEFTYTRNTMCPHCRGSGADSIDDVMTCNKCNGQGIVMERKQIGPGFIQQFQTTCPKCGGKGKMVKKECHVCHNKKVVKGLEDLTLYIEKGMENGMEIKFDEFGEERADSDPGSLIFIVQELKDPTFRREKQDLHTIWKITWKEAWLGFEKEIVHLDGHKVHISRDTVSQQDDVIRVRKEGMPIHQKGDNGDLFVKLKIEFPSKLTDLQKEKWKQFFDLRSYW